MQVYTHKKKVFIVCHPKHKTSHPTTTNFINATNYPIIHFYVWCNEIQLSFSIQILSKVCQQSNQLINIY